MSPDYSWVFHEVEPRHKVREPIHGEFFTTEAISNPGEALVREGIQNALDAREGAEPVTVRILVSEPQDGKRPSSACTQCETLLIELSLLQRQHSVGAKK